VIQSPEIKAGDSGTPPGRAKVTGRSQGNGRRVQRTVNFDRDTLDRARAAATYLARNEPDAGIRSLADIVNPAVAERVAQLEQKFNGGEPFQPVRKMPPGRPAGAHAGHHEAEVTLDAPAHPAGDPGCA
jgi:Centromere-binding protein ParB C-terminal